MELPATLRHAVDRALEGIPLAELTAAADRLSHRYRNETRDGRFHVDDDLAARAYLATRLPATFAAIRATLAMVDERLPDFVPTRLLDLGAGPGTALWAALDCWPQLTAAVLVEGSAAIRKQGAALIDQALPAAASGQTSIAWAAADLTKLGPDDPRTDLTMGDQAGSNICGNANGDLVTLCYVLDELAPAARSRLVEWAWSRCDGILLIVEPGTPAGWHRILTARNQLIAAGARIVAPCPHEQPCPLLPSTSAAANSQTDAAMTGETAPGKTMSSKTTAGKTATGENWCHFSRRVARSRLHRLVKQADVPWEDEKFIFIAAARAAMPATADLPAAVLPDGISPDAILPNATSPNATSPNATSLGATGKRGTDEDGIGKRGTVGHTTGGEDADGEDAGRRADRPARIIAPVRQIGSQLQLQLCDAAGRYREVYLSKRDGEFYKRARRSSWGDRIAVADEA